MVGECTDRQIDVRERWHTPELPQVLCLLHVEGWWGFRPVPHAWQGPCLKQGAFSTASQSLYKETTEFTTKSKHPREDAESLRPGWSVGWKSGLGTRMCQVFPLSQDWTQMEPQSRTLLTKSCSKQQSELNHLAGLWVVQVGTHGCWSC